MNDASAEIALRPTPPLRSPLSRRDLLKVGGALAVAGAVGGAAVFAFDRDRKLLPIDRAAFVATVGDVFKVSGAGLSGATFVLKSVDDLAGAPAGDLGRFIARFTSSGGGAVMTQGTYTFHHAATGDFDLFVVPGGDEQAPTVSAVFNRVPEGVS